MQKCIQATTFVHPDLWQFSGERSHKFTRNSAVADKRRDSFLKMQWRGRPKNKPLPHIYHAQLVRTLNSVVILNIDREHPKLGSAESPSVWDVGMSDPLKQATRRESQN